MMSEKDVQNLIELAESKILQGVTAAEALKTFVAAGIMLPNGEYTPPYQQMLDEANAE